MAAPSYHITNDDSGSFGATSPFEQSGPGTLLMDADAFLISAASTIVLDGGAWSAVVNGDVTSSDFSGGGNAAIYVHADHSSVKIGATADVSGYIAGIYTDTSAGVDINNKGEIVASGPDGKGIVETFIGTGYTIKNSGSIEATTVGIDMTLGASGAAGGIHTIVNSGTISAPTAIDGMFGILNLTNTGTISGDVVLSLGKGTVTNAGTINGEILFGNGSDSFTDLGKVKVGATMVTHQGAVTGLIDLGDGSDHFTGGNNAETVTDGNGADTYKLGGGNDTFIATGATDSDGTDSVNGGKGVDLYDASAAGGAITVNLDTKAHGSVGANTAVVNGTVDHVSNFENVTGAADADIIYGNAAANHIDGMEGDDQIFGFGGNDVLSGDQFCHLDGGDGNDILSASNGSELYGGAGNDVLSGGFGDSFLDGGAGADKLTGGDFEGAGTIRHIFKYDALTDSGITAATRDEITNFQSGGTPGGFGDFIDLSAIDTNTKTASHDDFHFIGLSKWGHEAGELRYVWTANNTLVEADVNGDGKMDFSITLDGHLTLAATDFIDAF